MFRSELNEEGKVYRIAKEEEVEEEEVEEEKEEDPAGSQPLM